MSDVNHNYSHPFRRATMKNLAITLAWAFAAAFLGAAVMGFVSNPLVGQDALL